MAGTLEIRFLELKPRTDLRMVERESELSRILRALGGHRHAAIVGRPGSGKTALAVAACAQQPSVYEFELRSLIPALIGGERFLPMVKALRHAAARLAPATVLIEDVQTLGLEDPLRLEVATQLLDQFLVQPTIRLLVTADESPGTRKFFQQPVFQRDFEIVSLGELSDDRAQTMLSAHAGDFLGVSDELLRETIKLARRYGKRALPDSALRLLKSADQKKRQSAGTLSALEHIQAVVAEQTGVPLGQIEQADRAKLNRLSGDLQERVLGQTAATEKIAGTIQRARLGLADPSRPRGSFLLLGPSGVGKTETAKALAELVFGSADAMVRLDMSEFGQAHMVARLTGSPPGYVGYDAGGQLTNPIAQQPYSLLLLDELEKAHERVFDIFLQVLDDGRLTDSSGKLVDFSQTVVLATSNLATTVIAEAFRQGEDLQGQEFFDRAILPLLLQHFRPEFVNRFDGILIYEPLSIGMLARIAQMQLQQLAGRLADRRISFDVSERLIRQWLTPRLNPLLGARPVRRLIRERFESPVARFLLDNPAAEDLVITGEESWLV